MNTDKVAILILAHKNLDQTMKLVNQFDDTFFDIFLHIDKKCIESKTFVDEIKHKPNVFVVPDYERVNVSWGDSSMLYAEQLLVKKSIEHNAYLFYVLISGQHLLIKQSKEFYAFLKNHENNNFNEVITDSKIIPFFKKRNEIKYTKLMTKKGLMPKIIRNLWKIATGGRAHTFFAFKTKFSKTYDFKFGSSWFCFNRKTMLWIYQYSQKNKSFTKGFNKSLNSEESYYPTLLSISPYFKYNINVNLTYIDWSSGGSSPKTLTMKDYENVMSSKYYFARKFDETIDNDIIKLICNNTKAL